MTINSTLAPAASGYVTDAGISDRTLDVLHGIRLNLGMANPGAEWVGMNFEVFLLGSLRAMERHLASTPSLPQPSAAVRDVLAERQRQDVQWGGPEHDDEHGTSDFLRFVLRQHNRACAESNPLRRKRFIKIAALAIAAAESLDRRAGGSTP